MNILQQLSQQQSLWSLEEFTQVLNELLPQFLPDQPSHSRRTWEEVTPRLVRHYATQGLLDEPLKEGRSARYTYRHLLQMLIVRRLLSEGFGTSAMESFVSTKTNGELEALLQGGVRLSLEPANPALAFIEQVKHRVSPGQSSHRKPNLKSSIQSNIPKSRSLSDSSSTLPVQPEDWIRLEILPGLELHLRKNFLLPKSSQEQNNLLQAIAQALFSLHNS